jgi:PIN domain nuclease of toxin-antitoxin system
VNLLLDTHVALWAITDSPRLSERARSLVADPANTVWVSVASLWEIAIKRSLGRGDMPITAEQGKAWFEQSGYRLLPIEAPHVLTVAQLPARHNDPFDRLLVAQALTEPLRLITHDARVASYSDTVILI